MKKTLLFSLFTLFTLYSQAQTIASMPNPNGEASPTTAIESTEKSAHSNNNVNHVKNDGAHQAALNIDFDKTSIDDIVNSNHYSKEEKIQIYHQYNRIQKAKLLAQKQELINLMKKAHEEHELTHQPIDEQEKENIIQKKEAFKKSVEQFKTQNRNFKISLGMPLNHPNKNHDEHEHNLTHTPEAPKAASTGLTIK
jgi:hypothetical protein